MFIQERKRLRISRFFGFCSSLRAAHDPLSQSVIAMRTPSIGQPKSVAKVMARCETQPSDALVSEFQSFFT